MPPTPSPSPGPAPSALTAIYEIASAHAFIKFSAMPPDSVRTTLSKESFEYKYDQKYKTRSYWYAPEAKFNQRVKDAIAAAGIQLLEMPGQVPIPYRFRKREIGEREAAKEREAAGVTLVNFDWYAYPEWAENNLTIKHKDPAKGFVRFVRNRQQKKFFEAVKDQHRRKGMVRVNIVKSRQIGFSTDIQGFGYYLGFHVPGTEALVTAHRDDAAQAVFRRTRIFEQRCPERKETQLSSKHEIQWKSPHDSALRTSVAEGTGRSDTRQFYHASEPAHYTKAGIEAMGNIEASVPLARGTFIIRETTALGKNHFKDLWDNAAASGFENFFTGFLEDDTARLYDVTLEDERWANTPLEWKEDEGRLRGLGAELGLGEADIVAALCFRRQKIASAECQGLPQVFKREYPATVDDAFEATGAHFFEDSMLAPQEARAIADERAAPAARFRINTGTPGDSAPASASAVNTAAGAKAALVRYPFGPLRIWKHPEPGESYIIPGDFGRGRNVSGDTGNPNKLDYTTFVVVNEITLEEVAVWHGRMDPDEAADQMAILGYYYNTALLLPETNHFGMIVVAPLVKRHRYPRIFRKEKVDKATVRPVQQDPEAHWMEYGWWTGATLAKNVMFHHMKTMVRERRYLIREPEAFDEMRTLMINKDGEIGAESGKHDDRVSVRAIGCTYLETHPKARQQRAAVKKEPGFLSRAWAEKQLATLRRKALGPRDTEGDYT